LADKFHQNVGAAVLAENGDDSLGERGDELRLARSLSRSGRSGADGAMVVGCRGWRR